MASLLAAAAKTVNVDLLVATLALVGTILAGIVVIVAVKRWSLRADSPGPDQAKSYQTLYEEGALSKEELDKISAQLSKKGTADSPVPPAPRDS